MQCFMSKMLHEYIPNVTMPFLDNIPIEGCLERGKYEIMDWNGCQSFVIYNTNDCECILKMGTIETLKKKYRSFSKMKFW